MSRSIVICALCAALSFALLLPVESARATTEGSTRDIEGSAGATEETVYPEDLRLLQAGALLEKQSDWKQAIALYNEVLADDPENQTARQWLARVLAWSKRYDESLAEYERLIAEPDAAPVYAVERAEVLSWAGRYDDAVAAFEKVLLAEPRNPRAARGLARTYRWAQRPGEAVEAYERALDIEEDAELRKELALIEAGSTGNSGEGDTQVFTDSDEFEMARVLAKAGVDVRPGTRLVGGSGYTWVDARRAEGAELPSKVEKMASDDQSFDAYLGVEQKFGERWKARVEAGGRRWERSRDTALARGFLEYTHNERLAGGISLDHGDFLARSSSLEAVQDGISDTTLRGWSWQGLREELGLYTYLEGSFLSDENQRVAGGTSLDYRPFADYEWSLSLGVSLLHFAKDSNLYYDPNLSVDGLLLLSGSIPIYERLRFVVKGGGGYGYADQDGVSGNGFTYQIEGGPVVGAGSWWLAVRGFRSESIRSTTYTSYGASLNLGRGF